MKISFSPMRSDETLELIKEGDALTVNDQRLDFSNLADGAEMPAETWNCPHLLGQVRRMNGQVELTLSLPHGAGAHEKRRFPRTRAIRRDGAIKLPGADEEAMAARMKHDQQAAEASY